MKRILIITAIILLSAFALYNSVYFEKLDARKQREMVKNFSPKEMVDYFWKNKLNSVLKSAMSINVFDSLLSHNPDQLVKQYGKSIGITSDYCFLVQGNVLFNQPDSGKVSVQCKGSHDYSLLTKYIFSNTARDATGYFHVDDFENTMDFNAISTEINSRILKEVIDHKFESSKTGTRFHFYGAVQVNTDNLSVKKLDIVPLLIETSGNDHTGN